MEEKGIATVGTFDGFHIGHRDLIRRLKNVAGEHTPIVFTFPTHPLAVVAPSRVPPLLCPREHTIERIKATGVQVVLLPFDKAMSRLDAKAFMTFLRDKYGVKVLLMGFNNRIGSDKITSHAEYEQIGQSVGVDVLFAPEVTAVSNPERTISSSYQRELLRAGDVASYALNCGEPFYLDGVVTKGRQLGRKLGFPTLNISINHGLIIPASGVYAGSVEVGGTPYPSIINIGTNPTISEHNSLTIEAHAYDTQLPELYQSPVTVRFDRYLRPERHFPSLSALTAAISSDIITARTLSKIK